MDIFNFGVDMVRQELSSNVAKVDGPVIRQSVCLDCQNKNSCLVISSAVAALNTEQAIHRVSPLIRKKIANVTDHLRREGFSFPNVQHPSQCWMHQKFGVATFYENQLAHLAEKMGQADNGRL